MSVSVISRGRSFGVWGEWSEKVMGNTRTKAQESTGLGGTIGDG